ncbi:MAG: ABC transporter substrate-binding protein [Bacteroidetes bacterium]|nr:ABC transporter substrate-binding protein [Bacteroidota bacterium]
MECTDQMGRRVALHHPPQRIVSLVPSQTELLYDLQAGNRVAGQTQFCIHPRHAWKKATKVGGTKKLTLEKIAGLQPDLIIGNKEENEQSQIEWLSARFPVWMSDIYNLPDALDMIQGVGLITGCGEKAEQLVQEIEAAFAGLAEMPERTALYLIWRNPWMAAGRKTFIHDMLQRAGFQNALPYPESRYPALTPEEMADLNPGVILLSSEPYPFREKHIQELQTLIPGAAICLADGEMFSWYGSRLLKAPEYFRDLRNQIQS